VSIVPAVQRSTPPSKSVWVFSHLEDVARRVSECHHSHASLLYLTHVHMDVVPHHSLACYFPLEHLLKVVFVIPMLQVEPVLAIQEPVCLQLILEMKRGPYPVSNAKQ
jgi:hypothetical protein